MSRTRRKNKQQKQETPSRQAKPFPASILIALILAGLPFIIGKYIEFNSPGAFDSGAYVYSAEHILRGAEIGVEEKPSAKLGTLLMNMLGVGLFGFSDIGPKVVQMLFQLAGLILMFIAVRRLYGKTAAVICVTVASFFLSAPVIAKFGNVKEQYMTAFMMIGISCYVIRLTGGKIFWAVLSGAFLAWAPLFKQTGISAPAAMGAFLLLQPVFRPVTIRKALIEILFVAAGGILSIAPLYVWILAFDIQLALPYIKLFKLAGKMTAALLPASEKSGGGSPLGGYVGQSREVFEFKKQFPIVMRYYGILILPVTLAVISALRGYFDIIKGFIKKRFRDIPIQFYAVVLFSIWWILDMAFVWISPRSYEQYYIPLNASAAMLGGFVIWKYSLALDKSLFKARWVAIGLAAAVVMFFMSLHIIIGIDRSPHWGTKYKDSSGGFTRRRGYVQRFAEAADRSRGKKGAWETAGEYIKQRTERDDKIYVWGWVPGIYVSAGRLAPVSRAFESNMHTISPKALSRLVGELVETFEKNPPAYIVDTRKRHFPWDRPPLELWPIIPQKGPLPKNPAVVSQFEQVFGKYLAENVDKQEAERLEAMKPLRDFVMNNYRIVRGNFGMHILLEYKG